MSLLRFMNKHNDSDEFDLLIEQHLDGLYGAALRYTRDPTQAQDLVHDTVVRALRFRQRFEMGTNFRAWVYTILTNTFIHRYRRHKREREILEGNSRYDVDERLHSQASRDASERPEQSYMRRLFSDDVLAALDSLPEDFRTVVVLCDVEGLSYKEIAEAIDRPVGTVMSRLYRGRRQLEKKLEGVARERGILTSKDEISAPMNDRDVVDLSSYKRRKCG